MTIDNENADPVGTPVSGAVRQAGRAILGAPATAGPAPDPPPRPRDLDQQQRDFTAEGSPAPGKVGHAAPAEGGSKEGAHGTKGPAGR